MKILLINPKLKIYKDHIDYPYYLNINLYLSVLWVLDNANFDIDVFDSFCETDSFSKQWNYYSLWWEFNLTKKNYDYILVNFSPFILYNKENIDYINNILKIYNNSKVIYLNSYTWWFCYIDYNINHLLEKWLLKWTLLNWNINDELSNLLWIKISNNENINIYSKLGNKINFNNYFLFLKNVSNSWLTDFYKINWNTLPFYSSKWCIFNCSFCTSSNNNIKWFFYYDLDSIDRELSYVKNTLKVEKIILLDALFNKDIIFSNKILDLFIKYDLKLEIPNWVRLDLLDENIIKKLAKLITKLSISIESWNKNINNKIIGKGLDLNKVHNVWKWALKYNLELVSHYIIWFPSEKLEDINDTLNFAYNLYEKYNIFPFLQFATPLPWTRLWKEIKIDLYKINLYEKFQTDYILKSDNFDKWDLIVLKENFYKKISVSKTKKIIINLTYACINNCVFCATWDRYKLSQKFSYVIAQLLLYYKKWVRLLDLDGWEPTLYKDLFKVIKIAKKIWYKTINLTSSWRKYKDIDYLEELLNTGVDSLLVSIHWTNSFIHDKITWKKWSYNETIFWLDNIAKLRKKYNFSFWINITLCKINEDNLEEYLDYINKWKPDILNIQFLTPFWNANDLKIIEQDTEKCCNILKEKIPLLKYKIQLINLPFCYMKWFEQYVIWDVNKMERDMIFVWETPSNLYEYLSTTRERKEKCNNCNYNIICDWFYKF